MLQNVVKTEEQLVSVCREHKDIYIYGAGMVGDLVINRLRNICNSFTGNILLTGIIVSEMNDDICLSHI